MVVSQISFKPVDLALLSVSGALILLGLLSATLSVPWNIKRWRESGAIDLNLLWPLRTTLALITALWMACQTLRLQAIWGATSVILSTPSSIWTAQGWMCRIYLTVVLGVLAPFVAFLTLHMLSLGARQQQLGELELANPTYHQNRINARITLLTLLTTLPIALGQSTIAWLSVWAEYDDHVFEYDPHKLPSYFFAPFWYSSNPQQQCQVLTDTPIGKNCTTCYFPAASVILHGIWTLGFVIALWVLYGRLEKKAGNVTITHRLWLYCVVVTSFSSSGVCALGASIGFDPFGWVNQGLWLAYALTAAGIACATIVFMVLWPSLSLRYISRNLHKTSAMLRKERSAAGFGAMSISSTTEDYSHISRPSPLWYRSSLDTTTTSTSPQVVYNTPTTTTTKGSRSKTHRQHHPNTSHFTIPVSTFPPVASNTNHINKDNVNIPPMMHDTTLNPFYPILTPVPTTTTSDDVYQASSTSHEEQQQQGQQRNINWSVPASYTTNIATNITANTPTRGWRTTAPTPFSASTSFNRRPATGLPHPRLYRLYDQYQYDRPVSAAQIASGQGGSTSSSGVNNASQQQLFRGGGGGHHGSPSRSNLRLQHYQRPNTSHYPSTSFGSSAGSYTSNPGGVTSPTIGIIQQQQQQPSTSGFYHHRRPSSSQYSSGGVSQRQHDTNPISNPLWFTAGLPPSYVHSPSSSTG